MIVRRLFPVFAGAMCLAVSASAEMRLAPIFTDHMVLAAGRPVRVFGTGEGRTTVTLNGVTVMALTSEGGWCATLPALAVGGPYEMSVELDGSKRVLSDVRVGEVLLLAGQSNMQFTLGESTSDPKTWTGDPNIRMFSTTRLESGSPYAAKDGWVVLDGDSAGKWSAIGYETAVRLAKEKNCAVGLVNCFQGASVIQAWLPRRLALEPRFVLPADKCEQSEFRPSPYSLWNRAGTLYERQFGEIVPYSVSAVLWYQGEANSGSVAEGRMYADLLETLIGQWRIDLGDCRLPFVVIELASEKTTVNPADAWNAVRRSQREVAERCPFVTCVRTDDICETDRGIHPPTKWKIGERVAAALAEKGKGR